jgi:hypothetical protein
MRFKLEHILLDEFHIKSVSYRMKLPPRNNPTIIQKIENAFESKPNFSCINTVNYIENAKREKVTEMWNDLVERRARRSKGGIMSSEAAVCRSFQAVGE